MVDLNLPTPGQNPNWAPQLNTEIGKVNSEVEGLVNLTSQGRLSDEGLADQVSNSETALSGAVSAAAHSAHVSGVAGDLRVVDARTNAYAPRPAGFVGSVAWLVTENQVNPVNSGGGDIILVEGEAGWNPLSLPGLRFWIDPRRAGVSNGASVEELPVYSADAVSLRQPDASKRPTFSQSGLGTGGGLVFDGSNDFMISDETPVFDRRGSELYIVFKIATLSLGSHFAFDALGTNGLDFFGPGVGYDGSGQFLVNYGSAELAGSVAPGQTVILRVYTGAQGQIVVQKDGGNVLITTAEGNSRFTSNRIALGSRAQGQAAFFNGTIGHVVGVSGVLSTDDRGRLLSFLARMASA